MKHGKIASQIRLLSLMSQEVLIILLVLFLSQMKRQQDM